MDCLKNFLCQKVFIYCILTMPNMKRGQLKAVIIILILVAAVIGLLFFTRKEGKAIEQPMPVTVVATPEPQEVVSKVLYEAPAPVPQIRSEPLAAPDYCTASHSSRTCHAATALARSKCPRGYTCKTVSMGWSAEGCYVEVHCNAPGTSGIKQPDYAREGEKQPYAAGYYRQPPSSGSMT